MSSKNNHSIGKFLLYLGGTTVAIGLCPILLGFGTAGITAGSVAAGIQSGIGAVSGGSVFATLTSLGMKGFFTKTAIGGAITSLVGVFASAPQKPKEIPKQVPTKNPILKLFFVIGALVIFAVTFRSALIPKKNDE